MSQRLELERILSTHKSKPSNKLQGKNKKVEGPQEFRELLEKESLGKAQNDIKISNHASKRLQERGIDIDTNEYLKLKTASQKLRQKGGKDSLIVTDKAAYIFDVKKNMLVTAIEKGKMNENVFTNIDSTLFV